MSITRRMLGPPQGTGAAGSSQSCTRPPSGRGRPPPPPRSGCARWSTAARSCIPPWPFFFTPSKPPGIVKGLPGNSIRFPGTPTCHQEFVWTGTLVLANLPVTAYWAGGLVWPDLHRGWPKRTPGMELAKFVHRRDVGLLLRELPPIREFIIAVPLSQVPAIAGRQGQGDHFGRKMAKMGR